MERIELNIGDKKALYHSETRTITHKDSQGVMITCEVPNNWALTRVFQYMEDLLNFMDE